MNHVEVEARYEIELEEYTKKIQIEGRVLGDIATNHVIPTAIRYQNTLIENVKGLKDIFGLILKKIKRANHFDQDISRTYRRNQF
jgi:glutamine synthetase